MKNSHPEVWGMVMADLNERYEMGMKKYGVALQPFNGRSALRDAYQEQMDQLMYLRQKIYEDEYEDDPYSAFDRARFKDGVDTYAVPAH